MANQHLEREQKTALDIVKPFSVVPEARIGINPNSINLADRSFYWLYLTDTHTYRRAQEALMEAKEVVLYKNDGSQQVIYKKNWK